MIVLELKAALDFNLDLTRVTPSVLAGLKLSEVKRFGLQYGRDAVRLADLFAVSGTPDLELRIEAASMRLHNIGAGLAQGVIQVSGRCGDGLGTQMTGGEIHVRGDARHLVGAGMLGGVIDITGHAGDFVGGGIPGAVAGMKGGTVIIGKSAGARVGDRMRRGLIVIGGNAGAYCASQMIAGTVAVLGTVGRDSATAMHRGSLLVREADALSLPETFVDTGRYELAFVPVLLAHIARFKPAFKARLRAFTSSQRWVGDRGCGGTGEVLLARAA